MRKQMKILAVSLALLLAATLMSSCTKNPSGSGEDTTSALRPGFPDFVGTGNEDGFEFEQFQSYITITKYTGKDVEVVVPEKIKDIPVTTLSDRVFSNADNPDIIHSILLPSTIEEIDRQTFYNCAYLESISVDKENPNFTSENGILYSADKSEFWGIPENKSITELVVPDGVTEIQNSQFAFLKNVETIQLPSSLQIISDFSFHASVKLKEIIIPEGTTTIGACAFFGCTSLERIVLPSTIESISANAFTGCSNIKTIEGYSSDIVNSCIDSIEKENGIKIEFIDLSANAQ